MWRGKRDVIMTCVGYIPQFNNPFRPARRVKKHDNLPTRRHIEHSEYHDAPVWKIFELSERR
jgi:hypothetical protein